jgi:hypothetical protein
MNSIRNLCFSLAILSISAGAANSARTFPTPPPPPQESHNNILGDELKFGPIGGAKSKPQVQVLNGCRIKYSKELEINTVWTTRFGRTGWWCTYKHKRT